MNRHRAVLLALSCLVPVALLSFAAVACQSDSVGGSDPVDWNAFSSMEKAGLRTSNLEELNEVAGFHVVLPTYLPEGMSKTFFLSSQESRTETGRAFIGLAPIPDSGAPTIQFDERLRDPSEPEPKYGAGFEVTRVGETDVGCSIHITGNEELEAVGGYTPSPVHLTRDPGLYPTFICEWVNGGVSFLVQVAWNLPEPAQGGIAPGMREEAMKVIASMIEDPYIP